MGLSWYALSWPESSGVYLIRNTVNGKVYIGSAVNLRKRISEHRNDLDSGRHRSVHLQRAWHTYSPKSFEAEVLELVVPDDLVDVEQLYIDRMNAADRAYGYNQNPTAGSCLGRKLSEETRRKIGDAHKGNKYCAGRDVTERTRKAVSEANSSRVWTDEMRGRLSESHKGLRHSDESKKKMSKAQKGRPKSAEHRMKLSKSLRGRKPSDETRRKMSEAARRRWASGS